MQHPKLNNFSVLSRVTEGVAKLCGKQEDIAVYPNPTLDGQFNISSPDNISEIKIFNQPGQIIYRAKQNGNNFAYHIEVPGIYYVAITNGEKTLMKKLIVLK